ncbi:Transmembrane and coiled-coil domain protein 3 [Bagarius yarrelli]|uniref:Transmembrane and coiled-coil domain protein 3 n=1 Tax=Bagarius yarrelli TaxID=175774 RepID=A0A556TH06_BAGYA|nr:Transmembrane and coiled-coil domain protein 3 [Bagarius yarrelli]
MMQHGGSDLCLELESDMSVRDGTRPRLGLDSLQQKMLKVAEQLRIEQALRDENLAEYLKLMDTADKQQSSRIKHVFEKKNQKSAQTIAQLQRKLEQYRRKIKECDTAASANGTSQTQVTIREVKEASRDSLKDCAKEGVARSASGRNQPLDKVKTVGPGVSLSPPFFFNKSKGFANLIRNKFGSADNIAHLKSTMETGGGLTAEGAGRALSGSATLTSKPKYPSDDECSTATSEASAESSGHGGQPDGGQMESESRVSDALEEVRGIREAQGHLTEDIESLRSLAKHNYGFISQMLQEERDRCERLEDQLNDLTELHQNETTNLKQELASIEEKVAYQAYERARDMQEALEACQTRVSKLELQQQQQQLVQLESANAKVLSGKILNIAVAFLTVVLVCVSTAAKFIEPLLRSRLRMFLTFTLVCSFALCWFYWEHVQCVAEQVLLNR